MRTVREKFSLCSVVTESKGPRLRDLDGNWNLDVSGSYGLNVAGFDRYKEWMEKGLEKVKDLGPVLGPLHPVVAENIALLKSISKLDEVSFHMSGTEAVMAAVRLARFNTRRKLIVCFSGAYHGWWDGVQPGLGSERPIGDCLTLKDLHPASLDLVRRRANEIAAVLINPVQSFHPNLPPPSDTILLTSEVRKTEDSSSSYARMAARAARGLQRQRNTSDLRRGVQRFSSRSGRSPGIFWRSGRHGRVWKDRRRRNAYWGCLRQEGADAAIRCRASHADRLCDRDIFGSSGGDGGYERIPEMARAACDEQAVRRGEASLRTMGSFD